MWLMDVGQGMSIIFKWITEAECEVSCGPNLSKWLMNRWQDIWEHFGGEFKYDITTW